MRKLLWSLLLASPVALVGSGLASSQVLANESSPLKLNTAENNLIAQSVSNTQEQDQILDQINQYNREANKTDSLNQVTNVSELKDVSPGDWAYEALRSLVERYGCIAGYPNGTFRGNRPMTRYEFAAGVNACLNQMERLISESQAATQEDLDKLSRLVQEFQSELAALGTRVDNLEGRVAFLEDHQFSTTTKLSGEVVFGISDVFTDISDANKNGRNTVFDYRVRLDLVSSFTGKDALHTRLAATNAKFENNLLDQGIATYQTGSGQGANTVGIDWLAYYFPIGEKGQVYLAATGALFQDFVPTVSPYLDSYTGATGSISSFGESNPIYKILGGDAGLGLNYNVSDQFMISAGYFGGTASDPNEGEGIFEGDFSALAQLTFTPSDTFQLAATYVRSSLTQGSPIFNLGVGTSTVTGTTTGTTLTDVIGDDVDVDSFGASASYKLSDKFVVNGYFGYSKVQASNLVDVDADVWYYGLGLVFPDLGKEGNLGGIIIGAEPYAGDVDDVPIHVEAFYKYQINNNISITPGVIYLTAPNGNSDNDDQVIGVLRTTFTF
jgi:hypothetical protein